MSLFKWIVGGVTLTLTGAILSTPKAAHAQWQGGAVTIQYDSGQPYVSSGAAAISNGQSANNCSLHGYAETVGTSPNYTGSSFSNGITFTKRFFWTGGGASTSGMSANVQGKASVAFNTLIGSDSASVSGGNSGIGACGLNGMSGGSRTVTCGGNGVKSFNPISAGGTEIFLTNHQDMSGSSSSGTKPSAVTLDTEVAYTVQ